MSTWDFEGLNNDQDDVERDFINGPQYDDTGDFWEEPDPQWEERSSYENASTTQRQQPPPSDYSEALRFEADGQRELDRLNRQQRAERERPVELPYLERQAAPTFNLDNATINPTALSTPTSYDSHEFITLEDSDSEDENEVEAPDMPPTRRSQRTSVVDLTEGSPRSTTSRQPKRRRSTDADAAGSSTRTKRRKASRDIEGIDLANEAPSAEEELLQAQQQEAIRTQQQATEDAIPQKIGQRSCIICLENFTNCTATACGHFFCHECLITALRAAAKNSDRGTGSCPVCRKSLKENKKGDVIPISFMTKKEYDKQQRIRA